MSMIDYRDLVAQFDKKPDWMNEENAKDFSDEVFSRLRKQGHEVFLDPVTKQKKVRFKNVG